MPYRIYSTTIEELLNDKNIYVPEHQRPYIWDCDKATAFISSIMEGLPTQSIIMYEEFNGSLKHWLEDGQQRWFTITRFINGKTGNSVKWSGRRYEDFSPELQCKFKSYTFAVQMMYDISMDTRIKIFQRIQDGKPLTHGQRFHACSSKPLVGLAKRLMVDPRLHTIWGKKSDNEDRDLLANAVALASGLALNDNDKIVPSYNVIGKDIFDVTTLDYALIESRIAKLLDVYSVANDQCSISEAEMIKQWDIGLFTGYILYTIHQTDRNWPDDCIMWSKFIVRVRREKSVIAILNYNAPVSSIWNKDHWQRGLLNVSRSYKNPGWFPRMDGGSSDDEGSA
jgi:Protein of unknown function DUF262